MGDSNGECCSNHRSDEDTGGQDALWEEISEEVRSSEKVINAFLYYKRFSREKVLSTIGNMTRLSPRHQNLIGANHTDHTQRLMKCIDHNHEVLRQIILYGADMFGEEMEKALRITQLRRPEPTYMSKVMSTVRQIVREWSDEGKQDRDATFTRIIEELKKMFPSIESRKDVKLLLPGSGLGRLPLDLVSEGFSVTGNEFSMFMLMPSYFFLNNCTQANQFTIYPFVFDKSNSWSYEDQTRPVTFPDVVPDIASRENTFSMIAGDFLHITRNDANSWNGVVTSWFIDTANNIIDYIETIYNILDAGGVWINVGPLTYHYEDMDDELSIELPYSEIRRLIEQQGFVIENEKRIDSKYTVNRQSMLQSQYNCAFFVAKKPAANVDQQQNTADT